MSENGPTSHHDQAPANNRGAQLVPLFLLCVLAAALVINFARGRNDQTLTGVVVMDLPVYKFYPDQNACGPAGTPYLLVPNSRFGEVAQNSAPISNLGALFHATWRVKLRGNLSHLGRYGPQGNYWRELDVQYVIDAVRLNCSDVSIKTNPATAN
jgi:hypothetical protein